MSLNQRARYVEYRVGEMDPILYGFSPVIPVKLPSYLPKVMHPLIGEK
jgi:hypothetical protein